MALAAFGTSQFAAKVRWRPICSSTSKSAGRGAAQISGHRLVDPEEGDERPAGACGQAAPSIPGGGKVDNLDRRLPRAGARRRTWAGFFATGTSIGCAADIAAGYDVVPVDTGVTGNEHASVAVARDTGFGAVAGRLRRRCRRRNT